MNKYFQSLKVILIAAIILAGVSVANAWTGSAGQWLIDALKVKEPLTFCNEPVPLNETDTKESLERELLVALNNSDDVILWLKRSNRYFPHIEKTLKDNGLPDDLKYIVIIESFLKPLATSHKGAVGYWQFIEKTGSRYGMKINKDTDERRNFFISTQAALAYLKDLYSIFNSWTLSAAAYNMGEDGLKTEMVMQKVNNFYHLYLNQETQRYIFKILAAKIILSDPDKFGFHLTEDDLYKPVQFETVEITTNQSLPVYLIATAANSFFKEIKELNPQLKSYYLPAGKYNISVPRGAASGFKERYELLIKQWLEEKNKSIYTVVKGDNLSTIAKRFNVSIKAIMNWNDISDVRTVSPGDKLIIFNDTNLLNPSQK